MPFVHFAKPFDLKAEQTKIEERLMDAIEEKAHLEGLALLLKAFQGKKITARIETFLKTNFVIGLAGKAYRYRLERVAGMTYLNAYEVMPNQFDSSKKTHFFLAYHSNGDVYDEEVLLKHNNQESRREDIAKLQMSLAKIPEFVGRYNDLLAKAQALVEDAKQVGLEYEFDIMCRGDK